MVEHQLVPSVTKKNKCSRKYITPLEMSKHACICIYRSFVLVHLDQSPHPFYPVHQSAYVENINQLSMY